MKRILMACLLAAGLTGLTSFAAPLTSPQQQSESKVKYTLFNPVLTAEQNVELGKKIQLQMSRRAGGRRVSSTQIAYDNGNAVITFAVDNVPNTTCDFGYVCFWVNEHYTGNKLSLSSFYYPPAPEREPRTENLVQYGMSNNISSWKHNNNFFSVAIGGSSQPDGKGTMVMANTMIDDIGGGCCPFSTKGLIRVVPWEIIFSATLRFNDAMVSVRFTKYPGVR